MAAVRETFSSRWTILLASLGMAIGTGNIWRFPRMVGQYGGTYLLLWLLFLFTWSIPLLLLFAAADSKIPGENIRAFTG